MRQFTDAEIQEIYFLNRNANQSFLEIAIKYQTSRGAIAGVIRRYQEVLDKRGPVIGTPLNLTGDWVVCGDVHIPCTDWAMASGVARIAERQGINRLIVAGDFMNFDAFSSYPHVVRPSTWEQERDEARRMIHDWLEVFDQIVFLAGNHERRLQKWLEGNLSLDDIFGLLIANPKITTSNFGHCTLTSGAQKWRITHPKNYSRNRLGVASDLALKFDCNILSFHEHFLAVGWDVYGHHLIVNGGGLVDPDKLAYAQLEDTRMAAMIPGFIAIKNGTPYLYGRAPFTDWSS